jgi:hypothetical protein
MALFGVVTLSGIFGLLLQQFLPAAMTARVPLETLQSQMDHVAEGLSARAYEIVAAVAGEIPEAVEERRFLAEEATIQATRPGYWKRLSREAPCSPPEPSSEGLKRVYLEVVRPYLRRSLAGVRTGATMILPDVAESLADAPEDWRSRIDRLQALCEESRQLEVQARLHRWLHGWLFIHAPISFALFVLVAIHVWFALSYKMGG